jgi:hypothetical protein
MVLRNTIRILLIGLITIALKLSISPSSLYADIYMYIDQNGVVHFTNVLTSSESDYRIYVREKRDDSFGI